MANGQDKAYHTMKGLRDMDLLKIDKPIRLIELFAGIGSQAKALKRLGANFEHYRICEFDKYAIKSYNAIHGTNFETSDITKITAKDLGIVDTDKYTYICCYSFPCQDLSLAGKQRLMAKGSGTRSSLLWEVERLLNECEELPQILLMENVTQVHGTKNKAHFDEWIAFLESKGYRNYWKDLNAKNFGIPQNRNRCFMVSVLGDYTYEFPKEFPLTLRLKDMLEKNVDEKFYLSDVAIQGRLQSNFRQYNLEKSLINEKEVHPAILARYEGAPTLLKEPRLIGGIGEKNFGKQYRQGNRVYDANAVAMALGASPVGNAGGHSYLYAVDEPFVVASRGRNPENPSDRTAGIHLEQRLEPNFSGCSNTLTTVQKDNYVAEPQVLRAERTEYGKLIRKQYEKGEVDEKIGNMRKMKPRTDGVANTLTTVLKDNYVAEPCINVVGNYSPSGHDASRIVDTDGIAPTVKENHGTVTAITEPKERFYKQALETFEENDCSAGYTIDAYNKKVNASGVSPTITTRPEGFKTAILPVVEDANSCLIQPKDRNYKAKNLPRETHIEMKNDGISHALRTNGETMVAEAEIIREEPLEREGWHRYATEVLSAEGVCRTLSTQSNNLATKIKEPCNLRIRKLTPKECWRLMGFDDVDIDKAAKVNSNTQLYKQAGNSIVVDVLCYIFAQML